MLLHQLIQFGQGKEADVYTAYDSNDSLIVLKFHRIGRTSFRKAKDTRHYLSQKNTSSWLYLSRLSAQTEYQNMLALKGFPIPIPIDQNRHCTVMSFVPGVILNNIAEMGHPDKVFDEIIDLAISLLKVGIVHADFSEFNIMIDENENVTLIDFPQCIPYTFQEAEENFNRDLDELRRFFKLKFKYEVEDIPKFSDFLDQIEPIDLIKRKKKNKVEKTNEEEEDDENEVDESVQERVSKEKRLRRKPAKRNPCKTMNKLKQEAKSYQ